MEIQIFNNDSRVAKTTKAYDIYITHELMRMYTLSFNLLNTDNARKYINSTASFTVDGQGYDITGFNMNSGEDNSTSVTAEHLAYRLLNYVLPANYTCVGTVAEIAADILDKAVNGEVKASSEFNIGTTPDLGSLSFALENSQPVTAKYAIMALETYGAESDYDNFTINFAEHIGSGSETFEYGVNLCGLKRTWTLDNGFTYDANIADLQQIEVGHDFDIGDNITVNDDFIGDTVTGRIIIYKKCLDDPTKNSIAFGNFKSDTSSDVVKLKVDVDNSIQQGVAYNSNKITSTEGFVSEATVAGKAVKTVMNATEGPSMTIDNTKVWGIDSTTGRVFTQSVGSESGSYAVIGSDETGVAFQLFNADSEKFFDVVESNGFALRGADGSFKFWATEGLTIIGVSSWGQLRISDTGGQIKFGDNAVGVDSTGVYKKIGETTTYL